MSSWAKASTKPSYNFSEIEGTVADSQLPDTISSDITGTAMGLKTEKLTGQEFVYRACPSTIKAKSLTLDRIYGKTLVWNQIVNIGAFPSSSAAGTTLTVVGNKVRINGYATQTYDYSSSAAKEPFVAGHIYLMRHSGSADIKGAVNVNGTYPQFAANTGKILRVNTIQGNDLFIEVTQ